MMFFTWVFKIPLDIPQASPMNPPNWNLAPLDTTNPRNCFYSNKQFANPKFILIDFCLHRTKVDKSNQKTIAINYLFMKINQKLISQFLQLQNNLSFQIVFWLFCHQKFFDIGCKANCFLPFSIKKTISNFDCYLLQIIKLQIV
jgi:hypothetical protein